MQPAIKTKPQATIMLSKLLPAAIKRAIKTHIRTIASGAPYLYVQSFPGENAYCIKPSKSTAKLPEGGRLPIPPKELWLGYASDAQDYITWGQRHVTDMIRALEKSGFSMGSAKRILEFGCAAGRMIRHLPEIALNAELWGVDRNAEHIRWCIENFTPAIHFATTTTAPHLPFEDRYFDLIFGGSVFTHIEDIQESWLLELGRILRPSGKLYITIQDEHTVSLQDTYPDNPVAKFMKEQPTYRTNKNDFNMIVVGRGDASNVFYNSRYFQFIIPPVFRWISLTTEAYGYQSAVILEKLSAD
jgi:ubiquinone/menaquinone biosynthesis C-methylase UbiE